MAFTDFPTRPQRRSLEARDALLDAAERLFAERGYFGASVREITDAAGTRLASINYHFGSKEALMGEVVRRRAAVLRDDRLEGLRGALAGSRKRRDRLAAIVSAYVEPMIVRCIGDRGGDWRRYFILVTQLQVLPYSAPHKRLDYFDEVAEAYIGALRALSPGVSEFQAQATFQFMVGAAHIAVCDSRELDGGSEDPAYTASLQALREPLVEYLIGGAEASLGIAQTSRS